MSLVVSSETARKRASVNSFMERLLPAPARGGFAMDDYWVWCGSVIRGDDGLYHMFASRWPKALPFFHGYLTHSEIIRATAVTPTGPFEFKEVVLPHRGGHYWDGQITHNPTIHRYGDTYLLFYIGATYSDPQPAIPEYGTSAYASYRAPKECYRSVRIGLATSKSVCGPWQRSDQPILQPRPGKWDQQVVTNPAPCIREDGRILMLYRSNTPTGLHLGVAMAEHFQAPFERVMDGPISIFTSDGGVEDPFIWWAGDHYEMLAKDMTGAITGEKHAGVHAFSEDGLEWNLAESPKAYSRKVRWDNGQVTCQGCLERPQLLIEKGVPTCMYAAIGDGPGGFDTCRRTWNLAVPLRS